VPGGGLEPPRLSTLDPKSSASTNSATRAYQKPIISQQIELQDFKEQKTKKHPQTGPAKYRERGTTLPRQ
jgi:hypothetical protein